MKMTAKNKLHLPKPNVQTGWDGLGGRRAGLDVGLEQLTGWLVKYTVNEAPLDVWRPEVRL